LNNTNPHKKKIEQHEPKKKWATRTSQYYVRDLLQYVGFLRVVIKVVSNLRQVSDFLRVYRFPPQIKFTATILLKYCWKWRFRHHNPNPLNHDVINVVLSTPRTSLFELSTLVVIGIDYIGSNKSTYHTLTTTTAPDDVMIWRNIALVNIWVNIVC
jgi:hypothetical protein